ncbi:hypothetical protein L313_0901 [Acinetobacter haemolyticus CIP 64.3 = MTCC 9819]|uniref:Lipoprotein n=2 Tax=Acinetobacter TaxID=469 RepID=A0A5P1UX90_9GAMM|nr:MULTISPECIES: hypothetical protein [Acinetobacter]EEH69728.1 hypothetical protein HMPREF0023_0635 [Acinetobacter sp. ATCC 27244]ENW16289.1 hypothetical protein F927_02855 [Acinetobacter haemolyticus CIP 64.3 = MTCC 9819]EPR90612.1 hypothetical protein L313_0901 [Acinetobacter haemolyticus CIP 64.3 = MTCC 9819]QER40772.1 hypothetical protein F2A31_14115 [Acinetobacter sp. C16S1]QHI24193.1 hypothetical protein Ahae5227_15765 [Acinetobacter haemolyticus]
MLKNKFVVLAMLPFMLSACGGGGGDSSSNNKSGGDGTQDLTSNGTRYYFMDHEISIYEDDDISIEVGDSLSFGAFEIFNKQVKDPESNQPLNSYLLTEKKLYLPTDIATKVMNIHSMTDWTYNVIGDVKEDWKLERVDLTNKNMFDTVLPNYRTLGFDEFALGNAEIFLNVHGNKVFPAGSACYRLVSRKSNQDTFAFSQKTMIEQSFEDFNLENEWYLFDLIEKNPFVFTYRAANGGWQGVSWTTIYNTSLGFAANNSVAVEYQGQTYGADYTSSIEWTAKKEIGHWETYLKNVNEPEQIRKAKLKIAQLKSGCYVYNEKAAEALYALSSLDWQPYKN